MSATNLLELTPDEIVTLVEGLGQPAYRGRQLATWIYVKGVADFGAMTDLPRDLRDRCRAQAVVSPPIVDPASRLPGRQRQAGLRLGDGRVIQSVLMPDGDRLTLCVSTQVGCGFGCAFCLTGTMGLVRNLTAGEIVGQVLAARATLEPGARLTHVVFMGMGEPLANYAATVKALRILVAPARVRASRRAASRCPRSAWCQGLERLAREDLRVNLAISLHAATDEVRSGLMPVNRGWGLEELLAACRRFPLPVRQRMTFEYVLLDGVNDSAEDAQRLVRRLRGIRAKVNLIPFNDWPGAQLPAAAAPSASSRSSERCSTPASPPRSAGARARTSAPPAASSPQRGQALTSMQSPRLAPETHRKSKA